MPKLRLSSQQRELLFVLEEAGDETLGCVLNTLGVPPDENLSVSFAFRGDLSGLLRLKFVRWSPTSEESDPLDHAQFNSKTQSWEAPRTPVLELTPEGFAAFRG